MSADKITAGKAVPETQLIARAQQGDEAAFEALFNTHKRRVYSLCLRMTGDTAEAEDLAQEAFLQLFRKISTFRGESAFTTRRCNQVVKADSPRKVEILRKS